MDKRKELAWLKIKQALKIYLKVLMKHFCLVSLDNFIQKIFYEMQERKIGFYFRGIVLLAWFFAKSPGINSSIAR
jgi:hypothetical protein